MKTILLPALALAGSTLLWAGSDSHGELSSFLEVQPQKKKILTPSLSYSFDHFENLSGGLSTGGTSIGLADLGLDLDLKALLGWQGATFTVSAFAPHGNDFSSNRVGDFGVVSNIFADTEFNIFRLQLVQEWGDSGNFIKVGQVAVDDDFMIAPTAELFINSTFVPFNTQSGNTPSPIFPLAAPGIVVHLNPWNNFSFTTGIYAGFSGEESSSNRGFDWDLGADAGYALFAQADYNYGRGTLSLGGYYHSGDFEDFSTGSTVSGLSAFWAFVDHSLIDGSEKGGASVNAFARASIAPQTERSVATSQFDGGIVLSNLLLSGDALGLACSFTNFGNDFLANSPDAGVTDSETIIELTYLLPLHENFTIQPDIQYIIDPHSSGENAFVIGARSQITF